MRLAGIAYLVYFALAFGGVALKSRVLNVAGTAFYFVLILLVCRLFAPVDALVAAALLPLAAIGCVMQGIGQIRCDKQLQRRALVAFGIALVVLGYLVTRSGFMPTALGNALVLAGIGWGAVMIPGVPRLAALPMMLFGAIAEGAFAFMLLFG